MSKPMREQEIEQRLRGAAAPEPPENLLAALEAEIPEDLADRLEVPRRGRLTNSRRWQLVAATLLFGAVSVVVVERVRNRDRMPELVFTSLDGATSSGAPVEPAADATEDHEVPESEADSSEVRAGAASEVADPQSRPQRALRQSPAPRPAGDERKQDNEGVLGGVESSGAAVGSGAEAGRDRKAEKPQPLAEAPSLRSLPSAASPVDRQQERTPETDAAKSRSVSEPAAIRTDTLAVAGKRGGVAGPSPRSLEEAAPEGPVHSELPAPRPLPNPPAPREVPAPAAPAPSTGGTAEPNDQAFGDMFFESAGVNPFIDTEDDRLSTFGLDVDTGSYTLARSYLDRGSLPPAPAIRVEEFVNFFSYGDQPPPRADFALAAEAAPSPYGEGERYLILRFGLHGRVIADAERKPAILTFVVDVSGSMERENRLALVKRALSILLDGLGAEDRVGLVTYGDRGRVLLEPSGDRQAIRAAIDRLRPGGSTNAEEGLVLGYELAQRHFERRAINRVILCSDGVANVGRTGPASILGQIRRAADAGIELTTVGFGMGNYNDLLMEQLADNGNGRYAYVDTVSEARRLFAEDLTGTLQTIAADAKVQVEFDPRAVSRYRLLGYENRDIADERFRDETVDAGEIGAGHQVSALYEVKLFPDTRRRDRLATLRLRWGSAASGAVEEVSIDLRAGAVAPSWDQGSPGLRLATVVAEFAEILRRSYWAREGDLQDVLARAQKLSPEFAGDADVAELVGLIGKAARLSRSVPAGDPE